MVSPVGLLEDLLGSLFVSGELRRFLRRLGGAHAWLEADLPDVPATPRQVAHEAAHLLVVRGLADEALFTSLLEKFPGRETDIEEAAAQFAASEPVEQAQPIDRAALEDYIWEIQGRADLIAQALCGGGPLPLSRVYVEVQLDPQGADAYDPSLREIRTVEAALARGGAWALLGEAGSGKSSLLHHVTLELLKDVGPDGLPRQLPVPLRAPRLQVGRKLAKAIADEHGDEVVGSILAFMKSGRAVLLIDGLDESDDVSAAARAVHRVRARASGCPTLLASRPEGYSAPSADFVRLKLCGLGEPEQIELLGNLGIPVGDGAGILARLRARPQLRRVAESPLLLTLVATLWREGWPQPERRSELFADAVRLLTEGTHRSDETHWHHPDPNAAIDALTAVVGVLGGRGQVWGRDALLAQLGRIARWQHPKKARPVTAVEALDQLVRTGLLVPNDRHRPRAYQFPHRSLGEHLAARHLAARIRDEGVDGPSLGEVLAAAKHKPEQWTEVLAQTTGLLGEEAADGLVRRVIDMKSADLMLRLIAEAEVLRPETFEEALKVERGWDRWEARRRLLDSLPARIQDPAVVVGLIRRFVQRTTDGNDLYWARERLQAIAEGEYRGPVEREVREAAAAAVNGIFDHIPKQRLEKVQSLLRPMWRNIPPTGERLGPPKVGSDDRYDERPVHDVSLTAPFQMLAVPVTWEMYLMFDPEQENAQNDFGGLLPRGPAHAQIPIYNVTWFAAVMFSAWVGARLPAEAEWELACRAGRDSAYWTGSDPADHERIGWDHWNSGGHPNPVALKPANPWGLHDIHGNVWEWCLDQGQPDAYASRSAGMIIDPTGKEGPTYTVGSSLPVRTSSAPIGDLRVLRGGSWYDSGIVAVAAYRFTRIPSAALDIVGFRLVRPLAPDEPSDP